MFGGVELVTKSDSNYPKSDLEAYRVSIIEEFTKRQLTSAQEATARLNNMLLAS
jgi:hypothetical protein